MDRESTAQELSRSPITRLTQGIHDQEDTTTISMEAILMEDILMKEMATTVPTPTTIRIPMEEMVPNIVPLQ